jgi:hypothetical protein
MQWVSSEQILVDKHVHSDAGSIAQCNGPGPFQVAEESVLAAGLIHQRNAGPGADG